VGVFPEGHLTRDGELQPFRPGISRILAANPVPVVPMALSGLWGSFFADRWLGDADAFPPRGVLGHRAAGRRPGAAGEATPEHLQQKVLALRGACR
jgi:hypothetical protein